MEELETAAVIDAVGLSSSGSVYLQDGGVHPRWRIRCGPPVAGSCPKPVIGHGTVEMESDGQMINVPEIRYCSLSRPLRCHHRNHSRGLIS
jgi:hypothetical protein